jgi:hypothetical protein
MRGFLGLLLVTALATGCSFTVGRLSLVTTRPVNVEALTRAGPPARRAEGRSCVPVVIVFPAGRLPRLTRAIGEALGAGTVLRDAVVRFRLLCVPPFSGHACYVVEGAAS